MLQRLEAGDDSELARIPVGVRQVRLRRRRKVGNALLETGLASVQPRHGKRRLPRVDPGDVSAEGAEGLCQQPAATAGIEHRAPVDATAFADVVHAGSIDVVQRLELAVGVPPTLGKRFELGDLPRVDVDHDLSFPCQDAARASTSSMSRVRYAPSS